MKFKAAFFDLDGTIIDSVYDLAAASNYALEINGYPKKPDENFKTYAGSGVKIMLERALKPITVSDCVLEKIKQDFFVYYVDHCHDKTLPYNGIPELIKSLKAGGIKIACITNKVESIATELINYFFGGFDLVLGQVEARPLKPEPQIINAALKALSLNPEEVLYIGDSNVDYLTAKNGNLKFCGVAWGFYDESALASLGADYIVDSAKQIEDIILNEN